MTCFYVRICSNTTTQYISKLLKVVPRWALRRVHYSLLSRGWRQVLNLVSGLQVSWMKQVDEMLELLTWDTHTYVKDDR